MLFCTVLSACATVQADDVSQYQKPLGFELNRSTFADVRSAFGAADQFDIPESHHEFAICYRSKESDAIVVFMSAREFGGPDKTLLGAAVHATNSLDFPCSPASLSESDLKIGGLRIDISEGQFRSMFKDEPKQSDFGHLFVHFDIRRSLTSEENDGFTQRFGEDHGITGADSSLGVWCRIADDKVVEFGVWQEETY